MQRAPRRAKAPDLSPRRGEDWPVGCPILADEQLRTHGVVINKMSFKNHLTEGATAGTYGCSGVRWVLEANPLPDTYRKGQIIRLFQAGWPVKELMDGDK